MLKVLLSLLLVTSCCKWQHKKENKIASDVKYEVATFGMGCFWCGQAHLKGINGVIDSRVGYLKYENSPTSVKVKKGDSEVSYCKICSNTAKNFVEVVQIKFDPSVLSYADLMKAFYAAHTPTALDRQGANLEDVGFQYKSAIFYHSEEQKAQAELLKSELNKTKYEGKIKTEIAKYEDANFKQAEWYHQHYWSNKKSLDEKGKVKIRATKW